MQLVLPYTLTVQPAAGKSLLRWADLETAYQGWFAVPVAQSGSDEFGYSKAVHTQLANGNLLMVGHVHFQKVREVVVPATLNGQQTAVAGSWRTITGTTPGGMTTVQIGGLLAEGANTRYTRHEFYNGSGSDWPSQGVHNGSSGGGMSTVPGIHSNYVSGYLCAVPPSLSNYTYLAGQQGLDGAAIGRWGPNFNAIKVGGVSRVLMQHDSEANQYPGWWIANKIHSMLWIDTPTRHGVLAFGYRGLTGFGYKANNDPYMGSGGYTATSYESFAWIYDPQHLLDVLAGTRLPHSLRPVEEKVLIWGNGSQIYHAMFQGSAGNAIAPISPMKTSYSNGRLIVAIGESYQATQYSQTPRCYVFNLS